MNNHYNFQMEKNTQRGVNAFLPTYPDLFETWSYSNNQPQFQGPGSHPKSKL
jgi:hypothetical protein